MSARLLPLRLAWGLLLLLPPAMEAAELQWSPDGKWLAYVLQEARPSVAVGWVWGGERAAKRAGSSAFQLWVSSHDGRRHLSIARSEQLLAGCCWHPAGEQLAYVRADQTKWQVVLYQGNAGETVLLERNCAPQPQVRGADWSHDGRRLAVAIDNRVYVVSVAEGKLLAEIAEAVLPSWSPSGGKLIFQQLRPPPQLRVTQFPFAKSQPLLEGDPQSQPPVWLDDQTVLAVRTRRQPVNERGDLSWHSDLVRVSFAAEHEPLLQVVYPISNHEFPTPLPPEAIWFAREGGSLLHLCVRLPGRATVLQMIEPASEKVLRQWNPVSESVLVGPLLLNPRHRRLAVRFGQSGPAGGVVIVDLETQARLFLCPSEAARLQTLAFLAQACEQLYVDAVRLVRSFGGPSHWPWLHPRVHRLPLRDEFYPPRERATVSQSLEQTRLNKIVGFADQMLKQSPPGSGQVRQPHITRGLAEMRLYFGYLAGDWPQVKRSLDALLAADLDAEEKIRLLAARTLYLLAVEHPAEAAALLEDLQRRVNQMRQGEISDPARKRLWQLRRGLSQLEKVTRWQSAEVPKK